MKWCFLVNRAPFLIEFFGKLATALVEQGDECIVIFNGKLAEYEKKRYFPKEATFLSKADWCKVNFKQEKRVRNIPWALFLPSFNRFEHYPFGYRDTVSRFAQHVQFFEHVFEAYKPDCVLAEPPSGVFHQIARYVSSLRGVPYFGLTTSRLPRRIDVFDAGFTNAHMEPSFLQLSKKDISPEEIAFAKNFLSRFLSHKTPPSYTGLAKIRFSPFGFFRHYLTSIQERGGIIPRYLAERPAVSRFDQESEAELWHMLRQPWNVLKRQFRLRTQAGFYSSSGGDAPYFLFPLHVQPEASTAYLAMYLADQLSAIRSCAFTLPFPAKLYVREHPSAVGSKPKSFYVSLREIPNVVIISPTEPIPSLIAKAQGVITLSSTVGLEAALAGKPVYLFGNVFYEFHPLCRTPRNFKELQEMISADTNHPPTISDLEGANLCFLVAYMRAGIAGSIVGASSPQDSNNYSVIVGELRKRVLRGREEV
ncbi:MAG: hypothetical protein HY458_01150 [Parcubacteria group bacterium]|nr:hypothetical protein [Parcubacteria group bacterium]